MQGGSEAAAALCLIVLSGLKNTHSSSSSSTLQAIKATLCINMHVITHFVKRFSCLYTDKTTFVPDKSPSLFIYCAEVLLNKVFSLCFFSSNFMWHFHTQVLADLSSYSLHPSTFSLILKGFNIPKAGII